MSLHVILTNNVSEIQRLKVLFAGYGKTQHFSAEFIQDINLALEETVSNIIYYGYEENTQKPRIDVDFDVKEGALVLKIQDDAKPFNLLEAPEPDLDIPFEEREIGGMGIHLIRTVMDEVEYARVEGKNVLTMKKFL